MRVEERPPGHSQAKRCFRIWRQDLQGRKDKGGRREEEGLTANNTVKNPVIILDRICKILQRVLQLTAAKYITARRRQHERFQLTGFFPINSPSN